MFTPLKALLLATALWHSAAVFFFTARTGSMLGAHTTERPVSVIAMDMMRFLGGMNAGYVVLAVGALWLTGAPLVLSLFVLALANFSQFVFDLVAHRSGRWRRRLLFTTVTDAFFTASCTTAALLTL